jgi:hypothetical protein
MGCCCLSLLECCATVLAYLVTEDWNETDRRHGFGGCWPTGTAFKFMALGWEAVLVAASRLISIRQGELLKNPNPNTLFANKHFDAHRTFS